MEAETPETQGNINRNHIIHWGCIFAGLMVIITGTYIGVIKSYDLNDAGLMPYLMFGWMVGIISVIGCTIYKLSVNKYYINKKITIPIIVVIATVGLSLSVIPEIIRERQIGTLGIVIICNVILDLKYVRSRYGFLTLKMILVIITYILLLINNFDDIIQFKNSNDIMLLLSMLLVIFTAFLTEPYDNKSITR
ncbi:MAG: hypothetical protein MPL62_10205 [Alphaproteobacteria bacterium]|nr:hypothetical protein [Alphaproteobacteria bacterium]